MLVIENLDGATVERAAALVAREQAAARQVRPELPADFESAEVCAAALERLSGSGHHGLVATHPAGYGVLRLIDRGAGQPRTHLDRPAATEY